MTVLSAISAVVLTAAIVALLWAPPIVLGLKWARKKGISPHWMWFGVHPLLGWVAFWIIRYRVAPRPRCGSCGAPLPRAARFCTACRAEASQPQQPTASADDQPAFRWFTNEVACSQCRAWVKFNASFCPQCSAAAPRLVCPACSGSDTELRGQHRALIAGIVTLFLAWSFFSAFDRALRASQIYQYTKSLARALTIEMTIYLFGAVLLIAFSLAFLYGSLGTSRKRVWCKQCNRASELPRTPALARDAAGN